jgi:hypothetical protein
MNKTFTGLGTFPTPISETPASRILNIKGKVNLPNLIEGAAANSQVVVTMNLNGGATFYTGIPGAEGFETGVVAVAGDILNIILTSSAPVDQGLNVIKTTVSLY